METRKPEPVDQALTNEKTIMNDSTFGIIPVKKEDGKDMFLLIKSRRGHWSFPKGHANKGETSIETARRELEEETGIKTIKLLNAFPFSETRVSVEADMTVTKTTMWFLASIKNDQSIKINDTDEIVAYKWLRFDDAYALLSHDETKRMFLDARLFLAKNEIEYEEDVARQHEQKIQKSKKAVFLNAA